MTGCTFVLQQCKVWHEFIMSPGHESDDKKAHLWSSASDLPVELMPVWNTYGESLLNRVTAVLFTWEVWPWQHSEYLHFEAGDRDAAHVMETFHRRQIWRLVPVSCEDQWHKFRWNFNNDTTVIKDAAKHAQTVTGDSGCSPHVWLHYIPSSCSSLLRQMFGTT